MRIGKPVRLFSCWIRFAARAFLDRGLCKSGEFALPGRASDGAHPIVQRLPYDMARSGQARIHPRHMRHFSYGQVGRPCFITMALAGQVRSQRPQPTHASLTAKLLQDATRSSSTWRIRPSTLLAFLHVPIAVSLVPPAFSPFTLWYRKIAVPLEAISSFASGIERYLPMLCTRARAHAAAVRKR